MNIDCLWSLKSEWEGYSGAPSLISSLGPSKEEGLGGAPRVLTSSFGSVLQAFLGPSTHISQSRGKGLVFEWDFFDWTAGALWIQLSSFSSTTEVLLKTKLKVPMENPEIFECSQVCLSIQIRGFCGEISKPNSTFSKTEPLNFTQRSSVEHVEFFADHNEMVNCYLHAF